MAISQAQASINGRPLRFETGKFAKQAGGAVTVQYGDTVVFAAGTVAKTIRTGIDFFPLTVDFEERLYAAGKIPGSFPRREGRPSEEGIKAICDAQEDLRRQAGKPKMIFAAIRPDANKLAPVVAFLKERLRAKLRNPDKAQRETGLEELKNEAIVGFAPEGAAIAADEVTAIYEEILEEEFRRAVAEENLRPDGRDTKTIRPLSIEVGVLPRTHGSGLFTRGQTQVLSIATLGPTGDEQIIDTLSPVDTKRFMHHYNFPPYSVGEVRPLRGAGRRDIGHGALVERALLPMIPKKEEFPYTIRIVSETLSSNGSTSMASTCGASLSLMDAGVPIKATIGGISIGLVTG